jgi:hypothetical protein
MTSNIKTVLLGIAALALVGGLMSFALAHGQGAMQPGEPVSEVIFPEQEIPLNFSHSLHLSKADLSCDDCHENAPDSQSSLDNLIPTEEACDGCHPIDRDQPDKQTAAGKPPARCVACHQGFDAKTGFVARVKIPSPNLKFNHKRHVDKGVSCETCHGDLKKDKVGLATREQLPKMGLCLTCHDNKEAPDQCSTCHLTEAGGTMQTAYDHGTLAPSGVLRGDDHDLNFKTSHKYVAQNDQKYCQNCHRKEFCVDCHNGTSKPMDFHTGDYLSLHPVDARRNSPDCSSCHRTQTFCVGCHTRSGLTIDNELKGGAFSDRLAGNTANLYHPAGWVSFDGTGVQKTGDDARARDHHAYEAQRNIKQCASCHREDFCITCHTNESRNPVPVNPHPNNWRGSARCKAMVKRAGRMCQRCHITDGRLSVAEPCLL